MKGPILIVVCHVVPEPMLFLVRVCSKGYPSLHWANVVMNMAARVRSTYPIPIVYSIGSPLKNHILS